MPDYSSFSHLSANIMILVLISCAMVAVSAGFIEQPEDLNATVNSTRVFRCRAENEGSYYWRINGTRVDPAAPPDGIIVGGSSLSVHCDEAYNMSTVVCIATVTLDNINNHTTISSDSATLLIQGRLGKVTNFRVQSANSTSITLSWLPPFSLDITGVEPDFTHTVHVVYVYNNRTGTNTKDNIHVDYTGSIYANATYNTSSLNGYVFTPDVPDPSVLLKFHVTAVNELGVEGEQSEPVQGCFLGPVRNITSSSKKTAITVKWDPPNISLDTVTYCVNVSNATDHTSVLNSTSNITEFDFTVDDPNPNDMFNISITPKTNLYPGEAVYVLTHFIEEPIRISGEDVQPNFTLNPLEVTVTFGEQVVINASPGRRPTSYRVIATNDNSSCECDVIDDVMNGLVTLMVGDCDGCLLQDEMYTIIIQTNSL